MAMLDRYKKTGGFVQLVALLETCEKAKKEKFLEIIKSEDSRWAEILEVKLLSIDRIYKWDDNTIGEIFGSLQDVAVVVAIHSCTAEVRERIFKTFSHARRRKIEDQLAATKLTPGEIQTMQFKIVEEVRKLVNTHHIRLEKIDPELYIDENIEAKLERGELGSASAPSTGEEAAVVLEFPPQYDIEPAAAGDSGAAKAELIQLRKKVADMGKENTLLRHEVSVLKTKMEQIKKII